ncbi:MAG: ABC transporter ATP-binding protein [Planctomycetes bacterium]|nr:ABC transporter ATP-binding protein [Planctomycetota bacterium]
MAALEVCGITKRFGSLVAVDQASFAVEAGRITGFIGPNGAGKTTTMRIAATLDLPDEGDVLLDGVSVLDDPRGARRKLGFMPDAYGAYPSTTLWEYLDFYARAYDLHGALRRRRVEEVLEFTSLSALREKEMAVLSKGLKQRLCLAKTLLHDPSVLILDEPAAGLDPRARVELRELVRALAGMRKAILVSSHILTELAEMCDGIAVIEAGRIKATGSVHDVTRGIQTAVPVFVRVLEDADRLERALLELPGVERARREGQGLVFEHQGSPESLAGVLAALVAAGLRPVEFTPRAMGLEEVFLSLTEGKLQ